MIAMGGRPIGPTVNEFFRTHPNRAYTTEQVGRMTGLTGRQVANAMTNARVNGNTWVDRIEDLDPNKRVGKRYRLSNPGLTAPVDQSTNGAGVAELMSAADVLSLSDAALPTSITVVGTTKQGPVVRDQNGKLYTLKEL